MYHKISTIVTFLFAFIFLYAVLFNHSLLSTTLYQWLMCAFLFMLGAEAVWARQVKKRANVAAGIFCMATALFILAATTFL
ncbi:hypothetical protein [Halobacillus sp. KGW1]|uniref:hypothetical protein n=1 Tax=Halobacillus sp. KGW1 TaxID=1793726 RepID=UPI00078280A1|nr:hypothetical protein [Halobacillus sp. KGW1]